VASTAQRPHLTGAWSGGRPRDRDVVTGTGPWDRLGAALGASRWGDGPEGTGPHRDAYGVTTEMTLTPPQRVACAPHRGSSDTTFPAGRDSHTRASAPGERHHTVLRCPPGGCGLYTRVGRRDRHLLPPSRTRSAMFWSGNAPGDVFRHGAPGSVPTQAALQACATRAPSGPHTRRSALAPAAELAGAAIRPTRLFGQPSPDEQSQCRAQAFPRVLLTIKGPFSMGMGGGL
jgi:hypothetical protein